MHNRKLKISAVLAVASGLTLLGSPSNAQTIQLQSASGVVYTDFKVPLSDDLRNIVVAAALTKEPARYRSGAVGPYSFDCSGLVTWAYRQAGIELPHGTSSLLPIVQQISREELMPGDLVFSGRRNGRIQHVALYIGNGKVIHATYGSASRANQVRIDDLDGAWVMVHKMYARVVQ